MIYKILDEYKGSQQLTVILKTKTEKGEKAIATEDCQSK